MSRNGEIAKLFDEISQMLELLGEDRFRVGAHAKAARVIESLTENICELAGDKKALTAIEGIGAKTADKITEFCEKGKITEHEALGKKVPSGLLDIMKVPGLGPKTVKLMWDEMGITSLEDLKKALDDECLADLPRMGEKTIENIRSALKFTERSSQRLPLGRALPVAEYFVEQISKVKEVKEAAYAGSLRRGQETIGDIDILVATSKAAPVHEAFGRLDGIEQVLVAGETKSSVRVRASIEKGKFKDKKGGPLVQVDLRTVPADSFGAALLYFTGAKAHNVRLRERAIKRKMTLNEYGLFKDDGKGAAPQSRGAKPVASKTERDIYDALDIPYLPPEVREDRGEFDAEETPELIELDDIKCELHAHTRASDGGMPLEELVKQAKQRGFHTIAVTDHSKSSIQANGLSVERLLEQIDEVHQLAKKTKGIKILAGSEVDIMVDGKLDYDDDVLAQLDHVVASPHTVLSQDDKAATKRLIKAIEHPSVRILGHPTGRLIGRREGLSPDMKKVIDAAVANDTALELNAHWHRLDLRDTHLRACVEAGCLIAINCDVHSPSDFDNLRYGILTARRGWVPAELCINTWGVRKLGSWLKR